MTHVLPSLESALTRPWETTCFNYQEIKVDKILNIDLSGVFPHPPTLVGSACTAICYNNIVFPLSHLTEIILLSLHDLLQSAFKSKVLIFFPSSPQLCLIRLFFLWSQGEEAYLFQWIFRLAFSSQCSTSLHLQTHCSRGTGRHPNKD